MHHKTEYYASDAAQRASEFGDLCLLGSLLCPFLVPLGLAAKLATDANCNAEVENARTLDAATSEEAESIAETWRSSRESGETTLRVRIDASDGGTIIHTFTIEDDD